MWRKNSYFEAMLSISDNLIQTISNLLPNKKVIGKAGSIGTPTMFTNGTTNSGRTLWLWDTLPKKPLALEDQTWLHTGDAVENVHRLRLGK